MINYSYFPIPTPKKLLAAAQAVGHGMNVAHIALGEGGTGQISGPQHVGSGLPVMAVIKEKTKLAAMSSGNLGKYFQKTVEIDESASNRVQARPLRFAPTGKTAELSPLHEKIRTMCARAQGSDYFLRVIGDKKTDVSCRKRSI